MIAFDLDGTLAKYDEWIDRFQIGKPIPAMIALLKQYLKDGKQVCIFTARADIPGAAEFIHKWLDEQGLPALTITNVKTSDMEKIYDDRAVQVEPNTGRILGVEFEIDEHPANQE